MAAPTPGNWRYVQAGMKITITSEAGMGSPIAEVTERSSEEIQLANARLLASAPQMAEALRWILEETNRHDMPANSTRASMQEIARRCRAELRAAGVKP